MSTPRPQAGRQRRRLTATEVDLERIRQRALLVGTGGDAATQEDAEASLDELALLADTAGADTVDAVLQRRRTPDPATYIGKGKAEELRDLAHTLDVDVVIVDDELTPAQQRNLEHLFKVDVVDRVALDPRHLRPARDQPGRRRAGRARAAALPVAAPAGPGHRAEPAGRGDRHEGSR